MENRVITTGVRISYPALCCRDHRKDILLLLERLNRISDAARALLTVTVDLREIMELKDRAINLMVEKAFM